MARIVHVELKLYADTEDEEVVREELGDIFRKSDLLILSSLKSLEMVKTLDIEHFHEMKKLERGENPFPEKKKEEQQ